MSIASVSSSSFREQRLLDFHEQHQQREQPEQHYEQQQQQQPQLLESVNRHKERVVDASLRVEMLECQIREEMEKLIALIGSSTHSTCSDSTTSHHLINNTDDGGSSNNNNVDQLEAHLLQLENDLLIEQRILAEHEQLYQVSLERTKQRWKQQIEEHQRRFRVCYRAVPMEIVVLRVPTRGRTKSL